MFVFLSEADVIDGKGLGSVWLMTQLMLAVMSDIKYLCNGIRINKFILIIDQSYLKLSRPHVRVEA